MFLSWLTAAISLQSGLPSAPICDKLLLLCPVLTQQRRYEDAIAFAREMANEVVNERMAERHWTEIALVFDGFDYSPSLVPLIPGLLVALPSVSAFNLDIALAPAHAVLDIISIVIIFCLTVGTIYGIAFLVMSVFCCIYAFVEWMVSAAYVCCYELYISPPSSLQRLLAETYEDSVRMRVAVYESRIQTTESKLCDSEFRHYRSQHVLGDCGREFRALQAQNKRSLDSSAAVLEDLKTKNSELGSENDDLKKTLSASQDELQSAEQQLSSKQLFLGALSQAKIDSDEQLEKAQLRITTLEGEAEDLRTTFSSTQERISSLEDSNAFLRGSVVKHKTDGFFTAFMANFRGRKIAGLTRTLEERDAQHADTMRTAPATIYGFLSILRSGAASHSYLATSFASLAASLQSLSISGQFISASVQSLEESTCSAVLTTQDCLYAAASVFAENTAGIEVAVARGTDITREHVGRAITDAFASYTAGQDEQSARIAALEASNAKLAKDNADLFEDNVDLHKCATRSNENDMKSWAEVAGLRIDLAEAQAERDQERQQSAAYLARVQELELGTTAPTAAEESPAPVASLPSSDSTASFMALSPSSDDNLDVQLPSNTSFASIDGFDPLEDSTGPMLPIKEKILFHDDPFNSMSVLAIQMLRRATPATPSPPHKLTTTKHIDRSLPPPPYPGPSGMSSYITPVSPPVNARHRSSSVSTATSSSTIDFDPPATSTPARRPTSSVRSSLRQRTAVTRHHTRSHIVTAPFPRLSVA